MSPVLSGELVQRLYIGVGPVSDLGIIVFNPSVQGEDQPCFGHVADPVAECQEKVVLPGPYHRLVHRLGVDIGFIADDHQLHVQAGKLIKLLQCRGNLTALPRVDHDLESIARFDHPFIH